jgi:hypothetical protein
MANKKIKKVNRWLYWTPRAIAILFLLFLGLFSFDVFDSCTSLFNCYFDLLMHSIPVFVLAVLIVISWKREIIAAWTFFIAGLLYVCSVLATIIKDGFHFYYFSWIAIIALPTFVIAWLFLMNWRRRKAKIS